jgi:hypothetical protein
LRSLVIVVALLLGTTKVGMPITETRVDALAFGCNFSGAKTVRILMFNTALFGANGRTVDVAATQTVNGGLRFSFTVPPGPIYIDYSVNGQKCMSGGGGIVVLPSYERHILVPMQAARFVRDWHAAKFVAGTMPDVPIAVSVVASDSPNCPFDDLLRSLHPSGTSPETAATIDSGAYYIDYVWGRHMFVKLSAGDNTLYVALPDAVPVDSHQEYVRRDITEADFRELTTHGLNEEVRCIEAPSGTSMRFP